jgi:hypothetical protein
MTYSDTITVNCTPEAAFALICDLPGMGRFSPENTGGKWQRGATGPAVGALFKGTNTAGAKNWTTTARVLECDAPHSFQFAVSAFTMQVALWTYRVESTPEGCRITESWTDRRRGLMKIMGDRMTPDREGFTKKSIATTLGTMKVILEGN